MTNFSCSFFMYWSPEQLNLYNDIQDLSQQTLSMDATSSVVQKVDKKKAESSDIFLTVISTHIENVVVPVCQVISEKNDTNFLLYWLNEWKKAGLRVPKQITTDRGKAIQNSISHAFNSMSFNAYNDTCLQILQGKAAPSVLRTQLSIDIAHYEHTVTLWPSVEKAEWKVKELIKRCMGFIPSIEHLGQFLEFLTAILKVTGSPDFDEECQEALDYLIERMGTFRK